MPLERFYRGYLTPQVIKKDLNNEEKRITDYMRYVLCCSGFVVHGKEEPL